MRRFHFYNAETGVLHPSCVSINAAGAENVAALNCPPGHKPVEGHLDERWHRVDVASGKVIDYVPPQPSPDHEWSDPDKRWRLSAAADAKASVRAAALARIAALEASGVRAMREAQLGQPGAQARLAAIDVEIVKLRADL